MRITVDKTGKQREMSKHKIFVYRKLNDGGDVDYADGGGDGINMNHRPMVGDVILQVENGYPSETLVIEYLILLRETLNNNDKFYNDEFSYWHAYCDSVGFDFSLFPFYGKSGDVAKLAAHAVDQRAVYISRYGEPPYNEDIESYGEKCDNGVTERLDEFRKTKKA